jgi:hypothetical protein
MELHSFEDERGRLVAEWVRGSWRRTSIVMKRAVRAEFKLGGLIYERSRVTVRPAEVETLRPVVRRMYEETQADLRRRGVTVVRLYRGVKRPMSRIGVLESWTLDPATAERFGTYDILVEDIPAARIFMYYQGPGWQRGPFGQQYEYIVMSEAPQ